MATLSKNTFVAALQVAVHSVDDKTCVQLHLIAPPIVAPALVYLVLFQQWV